MVRGIKIVLIIGTLLFLTTCKKKTSITVRVFNPGLNEYVSGAIVSLMEIKDGSLFTSGECTEIATAITDANGVATFDNEKLRTKSKYHYKVGIKESWGIAHQNPCGGQRWDYLKIGTQQEIRLDDNLEIEYKVEYNSTYLNPSISGDSLICTIQPMTYYNSDGSLQGGGGGSSSILTHDMNFPIVSTFYSQTTKLFANRFALTTRKRKMGVVTTTVDTIRAYPGRGTVIIRLNW